MTARRAIAALFAVLALAGCGKSLDRGEAPDVIRFSILSTENAATSDIYWKPILADMERVGIRVDPERLALAERVGAIPVDVTARHPATALAEATEGRGADVVIEAVGSPTAFESAVNVVRRGGRVVVVGVYAGETVEVQLGVYWARALDLRFVGLCPVHAWWERALAEVVAGTIDPTPLISHRLSLEDAPRGYQLFDRREATKVVLIP